MIDLIITHPAEGPASLFTRNFRVHSGIPIGLYNEGARSPVVLVYGDVSVSALTELGKHYSAIIAIPFMEKDYVPENPCHYETMTVKAPILATMQNLEREGLDGFVKTFEGGPLVLAGYTGKALTLIFTADLIKATIRILSGEIEGETGKDGYGRHNPPPGSITDSPGVSLHFNLIENTIRYVYHKLGLPLLSIPRWPSSAPLAVFLSHDVDIMRKWTVKRSLYEFFHCLPNIFRLNMNPIFKTARSIADAIKGRDPYWMFDDLLIMEHGNGFKSTWFFAPFGGEYDRRVNDFDPVYHRKPSEITAMFRKIHEKGCELTLHGIRSAFLDAKVLKKQLESFEKRLGFKFLGVRHHYLMFRHGQTLEAASEAGLMYDTTLGFSDRAGFRNGMATPFFPFPVDHPAGGMVEIPLIFMDTVFTHSQDTEDQVKRQITESYLYAKAARGLFSVNIHPRNMNADEIPALDNFYHSLLSRFRSDQAHSMTGSELAHWWKTREKVLRALEYSPDMWRVKGVALPQNMEFSITAPAIKNMRFSIEGTSGSFRSEGESLTIHPGVVNPETGITIMKKTD